MPIPESTLDHILDAWHKDAAASGHNLERIKGIAFENLCIAFLMHDPLQKAQYEPPVTYAAWASGQGVSEQDIGVDLVAKIRDTGGWCAIQCKFFAKGKTLRKEDLDSFLAMSGKKHFERRIIIDTTGKHWSKQAEDTIRDQAVPVLRIGLHDLKQSPIDWAAYVGAGKVEEKVPQKTPRPHQEEAIRNVVTGLQESGSRGKLLMACGTGKTFTSLRIAEDLAGVGGRVLYLVPSLALMSQTVREWAADTRFRFRAYAVCSDAQVGRRKRRNDDRIDLDHLDLAYPATTDAKNLALHAGTDSPDRFTVMFATYHSLPVIGKAQREHGLPEFDVAICDEAHRTAGARIAGDEDSHFVQIHDQEQVRTDRRLYMTATPKVYAASARNRADKLNVSLCSSASKRIRKARLSMMPTGLQ